MKYQLASAFADGREAVVVHHDERLIDVTTLPGCAGARSVLEMLNDWEEWSGRLPAAIERACATDGGKSSGRQLDSSSIRWRPPIGYPAKLICVGANYTDHIAEMGHPLELKYPYSFLKPSRTLIGSGEEMPLPSRAKMIDWEAELAVVIGRRAKNVRGEEARAAIAGYSIINDVSARDWLDERSPVLGPDWVMGKAFDRSAPMGPFLTPAEFVPDPQDLRITLKVNGVTKQDSTTENMVFGVHDIVAHLSEFTTLEPGDVIATGSPAGVGWGRTPRESLRAGDKMTVEIAGLGLLETPVRERES